MSNIKKSKSLYVLAGKAYRTKADVMRRCRDIMSETPNGSPVALDDAAFLLDLFSHHTEWQAKYGLGISAIIPGDVAYGSRGFWLHRVDGSIIDISFHHAVKHLPTPRTKDLMPQPLIDFKRGARQAIRDQVDAFRATQTPIDGDKPSHVDHIYPRTFDALLLGFCLEHKINPLGVEVLEQSAGLHYIVDDALRGAWAHYHARWAVMALVTETENLKAPKAKCSWHVVWENLGGTPSIESIDAFTRNCPSCGHAFQRDEHDDPSGAAVWDQWEGPCCASKTSETKAA